MEERGEQQGVLCDQVEVQLGKLYVYNIEFYVSVVRFKLACKKQLD